MLHLLNSINPIAAESLSPELLFLHLLAISGCEGNSETPFRADCLPTGTFQYRSSVGSHHFHLCNYRDDHLRSCEAPGSRGRFGQLWNLRSINAAFVQVCTKKVLSKGCRDSSNRIASFNPSQRTFIGASDKYFIRPSPAVATILRHPTIEKINQHLFCGPRK